MFRVRVALRPCLPALHYRHLEGPFTLYAELVRFPIYCLYRGQAFDLQVSPLEVLRTQTELQTEHGRLQTLAIHLGDVRPPQVLCVDLIANQKSVASHVGCTRRVTKTLPTPFCSFKFFFLYFLRRRGTNLQFDMDERGVADKLRPYDPF